jgi:hypothetical protein
MSEKAVGQDWKKKKICTLRHAAGCAKFLAIPKKKEKREGEKGKEGKEEKATKKKKT